MLYFEKPNHFRPQFEAVSCLIQYHEDYLFLQRTPLDSHGNLWGVPTGKVKSGESLRKAMIREIKEETGIKLNPDELSFIKTFYVSHNQSDFSYHLFQTKINTLPEVQLNINEHSAYQWCQLKDSLHLPLVPDMDEVIIYIMKESI
ncbi:MAG: hypothetical protein Kow00108_17890 [Calditrichia bacterium]